MRRPVLRLGADGLGDGDQVGFMRFEEAQERRKQVRLGRPGRNSSVSIPDRSRNRCARRSSVKVAASAESASVSASFVEFARMA